MRRYHVILACLALLLASCSVTKSVPDGEYLLDKTKIIVNGTEEVLPSQLDGYLRQTENTEVLGFWKMQLNIYNWADNDTTKKINAFWHRLGEAPEIFDPMLANVSMHQLRQAMFNKGYLNATVDTTMSWWYDKRVRLTYHVTANEPYYLRIYNVDKLPNDTLQRVATSAASHIQHGMIFDSDVLLEERERIARYMRNHGYYNFTSEHLTFEADSALGTHQVDLILGLQKNILEASDSVREQLFSTFTIKSVTFFTVYDKQLFAESEVDTIRDGAYTFIHAGEPLLRQRALINAIEIIPGDSYSEHNVERTYATLSALGPIKYANIAFKPDSVETNTLHCTITLSKNKPHSVTAEVEGTYSAGDWGVAAGVGYINRNIFHGGEEFSVNARGSYEWRANGSRGIEAKTEAALKFPNSLKLSLGYNYQQRPGEFTRTIASAAIQYTLPDNSRFFSHYVTPFDISYVYLPDISDAFRDQFLRDDNILKYSYEDHFILDWSYVGTYSTKRPNQPLRNHGNIMYGIETAGNFLYAMSNLFHQPKDKDGYYKIFNIRYAQYAKADLQMAYNWILNEQNTIVAHAGFGVAVPFGNASVIPFEKRYYAGGANSVRGWTIRSLGPGAYRGNGSRIDYNNQAGDIKLDLNLEYRFKAFSIIELAAFMDAGNIWTIDDYTSQPHGQFTKHFYKEIAWSYGFGLRLDFSIFVFRVDLGVKLYDPSYLFTDTPQFVWRTAENGLKWKNDATLHFAIGYPF